jgi:hypothetical protein
MNFFDQKDVGNHPLKLCPKVVKHPVYIYIYKRPKRKKMDMRFGTWNVRSMYRAGSLRAVVEEIKKYKLDLVGVQDVRWDTDRPKPAGECIFFYGKGNENHELGACFFIHKRIIYRQLRG